MTYFNKFDTLITSVREGLFYCPILAQSRLGRFSHFLTDNRNAPFLLGEDMKEPWVKTYNSIIGRCHHKKSRYYKNGIKCLITKEELKNLWFRDKAFKMKKPSIDRINNKGNYKFYNCRYIEFSQNARLGNLGKKLTKRQMQVVIKNIEKANLMGRQTRRPVSNYLNGTKLKTFNSITEASKNYNILITAIVNCCKGLSKTSGGFVWEYETKGRVVI